MRVGTMYKILLPLLLPLWVYAQTIDCNRIFEQRKGELILELERIDEQKQSLQALKEATESILERKEQTLTQREQRLEQMMEEIEAQKSEIEQLVEKNQQLLEQIEDAKMTKITQAYADMKSRDAASILQVMELEDAIEIMRSLEPDILGDILSTMNAQRASEITRGLRE